MAYLKKTLREVMAQLPSDPSDPPAEKKKPLSGAPQAPPDLPGTVPDPQRVETNKRLAEIFKKIGDKENTKEVSGIPPHFHL